MKRLAVLNLIQLVTTRKRPKGTTYIHVNLINQTKVLLRRKMCTSWFHFTKKKKQKRNYLTEGTGELFCDRQVQKSDRINSDRLGPTRIE